MCIQSCYTGTTARAATAAVATAAASDKAVIIAGYQDAAVALCYIYNQANWP